MSPAGPRPGSRGWAAGPDAAEPFPPGLSPAIVPRLPDARLTALHHGAGASARPPRRFDEAYQLGEVD